MVSRAQWRFGIFAVGLQMTIKLNQVKVACKHLPYFNFIANTICESLSRIYVLSVCSQLCAICCRKIISSTCRC